MNFSSDITIEFRSEHIFIFPKEPHTQTLIFLHGLGDSPKSYLSTFVSATRPVPLKTKIILLASPIISVTCFNNQTVNSWFNIKKFPIEENNYEMMDIIKNTLWIKKIINQEIKLLNNDYKKILLGGFSQGAMMALFISFHLDNILGGIIALSGALIPESLEDVKLTEKENMNIFIGHGTADTVIRYDKSKKTLEPIIKMKNVILKAYDQQEHCISDNEFVDMKEFCEKCLKAE